MTDVREEESESDKGVVDTFNVAFWNLQNLFDLEGSAIASDMEFTPVHGWDRRALERRIVGLAEIIQSMFDADGPDLLGICEIENARLAEVLIEAIGREDYKLAFAQQPGAKALDTALIYSADVFQPAEFPPVGHVVDLRYATFDIRNFI